MISSSEIARNCNVTLNTIKSDINALFNNVDIKRTRPITGKIILSFDQTRKIYEKRGFGFKKTIVTIGNQKGGVGKSLLTLNTAIKKSKEGAKVLIIDLDPESCATNFLIKNNDYESGYLTMLEVFKDNIQFKEAILNSKYPNLDIVPCRGKARRTDRFVRDQNIGTLMKKKLEGLAEYDLIMFEVPPTFSNVIEAAYIASDLVIMPCFPDAWSIESCMLTNEDIQESCEKWEVKFPQRKILLNRFNDKRKASQDAWNVLTKKFAGQILPITIKDTTALQNSINNGNSIFDKGIRASKELKESFRSLSDFICPLVNKDKEP